MLNFIIYHFGSGHAFFLGVTCILIALGLSFVISYRGASLARNLAVLIGGILVTISATPLPWWLYGLLAVVTLVWLTLEWCTSSLCSRRIAVLRITMLVVWLAATGLELPYHVMPSLPPLGNPTCFLIGDSVSAGTREADPTTWPNRLAAQHPITIRDFSKMGATVGSARRQAERIGDETGLVLLEIGGNDVLGSTTADEFEERLDALLADVCRRERTVVMLELPLPPFANRFGQAQRSLAEKYQVILIPKRFFAAILTTDGATVDGIHLSPMGHAMMAEAIWDVLHSAYDGHQ